MKLTSTTFFVFEIFGEIIAKGFAANGPESFMRSPFNIINLISTLSAIATIVYDEYPFVVKYILDLFQVLRVLRFLSMNKAFRLLITAIIYGVPKILQTLFIAILFILIFTIIGVQLYKDYFYYCASHENDIDTGVIIDTVYDCMDNGKYWRLHDISFNNLINAFITLF